jgi:hypothetical protein
MKFEQLPDLVAIVVVATGLLCCITARIRPSSAGPIAQSTAASR